MSVTNGAGIPANHAHHDRLLVSRHAADDSYPGEVEQARALIAQCADCAALATNVGIAKLAARPALRQRFYASDRVVRLRPAARGGVLLEDLPEGRAALLRPVAPYQRTLDGLDPGPAPLGALPAQLLVKGAA